MGDLEDPQGTYELVDEHSEAWKQTFLAFTAKSNLNPPPLLTPVRLESLQCIKSLFGFGIDEAFEHIAYYELTRKMHKDPVGARFISSSESSSMQPVSQGTLLCRNVCQHAATESLFKLCMHAGAMY